MLTIEDSTVWILGAIGMAIFMLFITAWCLAQMAAPALERAVDAVGKWLSGRGKLE